MTIQYDVFLSHNSEDKPYVKALAKRLEHAGFKVWLDKWDLIPGEPWQESIEDAVDQCQNYIVCLGRSGRGPWHNEEMYLALNKCVSDRGRRLIPILLPGFELAQLPGFLSRFTWVDFRNNIDDEDEFHRLVAGIKGTSPRPNGLDVKSKYRSRKLRDTSLVGSAVDMRLSEHLLRQAMACFDEGDLHRTAELIHRAFDLALTALDTEQEDVDPNRQELAKTILRGHYETVNSWLHRSGKGDYGLLAGLSDLEAKQAVDRAWRRAEDAIEEVKRLLALK